MKITLTLLLFLILGSCEPYNGNAIILSEMKSPVIVISTGSYPQNAIYCAFVRDAAGKITHLEGLAIKSLSVGDTIK
jgi:hypothetical protein